MRAAMTFILKSGPFSCSHGLSFLSDRKKLPETAIVTAVTHIVSFVKFNEGISSEKLKTHYVIEGRIVFIFVAYIVLLSGIKIGYLWD